MATYVNDLRLKEIGTGESSGTWGTETNVNLELIGEALSFGTEAITTNADTHTSTVADGSTDPARSMYIKYTGTLDSACTITIAPNTLSRLHFIENGTSGSQNIIISQGSGANVTIPAGDVKVVYLDGAGSGAAVVDAFASLNVVDLKVEDDLTVTDDVSIGGALTLTGNADFNGDLDVDGTTNLDVVDIDGAVDMASTLQVDGNVTTSGTFNIGSLGSIGAVTTDRIFIATADGLGLQLDKDNNRIVPVGADGTTYNNNVSLGSSSLEFKNLALAGTITAGATTLSTADNTNTLTLISTDADAAVGPVLDLYRNSGSPADDDFLGKINFRGRNDNSQDVNYGYLSYFIADASDGTEDAFMQLGIMKGGSNTLLLEAGASETVFNQSSVDQDFRVESNGNDHMLFVDAGNDHVNIGTSSDFGGVLNVNGGAVFDDATTFDPDTLGVGRIAIGQIADGGGFAAQGIGWGGTNGGTAAVVHSNGTLFIGVGDKSSADTLDSTVIITQTEVAVNDSSKNTDFRVESNSNASCLIVDGGNDTVLIGKNTTSLTTTGSTLSSGGTATFAFSLTSANESFILNNNNATGATYKMDFRQNNSSKGSIACGSSSTAFNTSSDYRLKENVETLKDGLTRLAQLKPVQFNWKTDGEFSEGFIAHEVDEVFPCAVSGEKDAVDGEGNIDSQQMDYGRITPLLVKAIQEQQEQIEELKAALKGGN